MKIAIGFILGIILFLSATFFIVALVEPSSPFSQPGLAIVGILLVVLGSILFKNIK